MKWTAIMYAYGDYQQLETYRNQDDAKNAVEREIGKKMRKKRISNEEYELDGRHLAITVQRAKEAGYENLKENEMKLNEYSSGFNAIDLTSKDMKVIDAFLAHKKAKSDHVETDGTYLTAAWRGSGGKSMAFWLDDEQTIGMGHITGKDTDDAYHSVMDIVRKEIKHKHIKLSEGIIRRPYQIKEVNMKKSTRDRILELANIHESSGDKPGTIPLVNKAIKHLGYVLRKGAGYYYFTPIDDAPWLTYESEPTYRVGNHTVDEWVQILKDKMEE